MRSTIVLAVVLCAPLAHGRTIAVPPGPGTPVQDAIDAANPGDTIRLALGTYPERLVITKAIKIRGVASTSVEPNGVTLIGGNGCIDTAPTILILADRVQLRAIAVGSNDHGGIDVDGHHIKLVDVFVGSQCEVVSAPRINVEFSTYVTLSKAWAASALVSHVPAGIRIANVQQQAHIRVSDCNASGNDIGLLLENAGPRSVRAYWGHVNFNDQGIVVRGTSGAVVHDIEVVQNTTLGIGLDAASSQNAIVRNRISGSATDVEDDGTSNCWRNNTFTTGSVPSCP